MYSSMSDIVQNSATRFGVNEKELKRFVKFAVVGVIGAVVDFGIFNILRVVFYGMVEEGELYTFQLPIFGEADLLATTFWVSVAGGISFIAAIISNFIWNRYWTYPDSRSKSLRRQFAQFFFVNLLGIVIRVPIVGGTSVLFGRLVSFLLPNSTSGVASLIGDNLAVVLAVGIVMFWNFFVNRYWTYNDVDS